MPSSGRAGLPVRPSAPPDARCGPRGHGMKPIHALIVDDEAPARSELRYLLEQRRDVQVVGEAAGAAEALALARAVHYDVVFLDIQMPGLTGLEAAPLVSEQPRAP